MGYRSPAERRVECPSGSSVHGRTTSRCPRMDEFASGRDDNIRAPCSAYSAMAIAATIREAAEHCDQYPSTRCYSTLGTRRAAHHQTFLETNAIYDELVRLWRLHSARASVAASNSSCDMTASFPAHSCRCAFQSCRWIRRGLYS